MRLGKLQRNQLFRTVESGGLDPHDFELSERNGGLRLTHQPSGAELFVRRPGVLAGFEDVAVMLVRRKPHLPGAFVIRATLPDSPPRRYRLPAGEELNNAVNTWTQELAEELATPDFWSTLGSVPRMADAFAASDTDNSMFDPGEQQEIEDRISVIKEEAREHLNLSPDQLRHLEAKLDYLVAASKRVGRLDWRNLVAGTVLTLATEAVLPAETTHRVFSLLLGAVSHLAGHPTPQLGP